MLHPKYIIPVFILLCNTTFCVAQDSNKTQVPDSTTAIADPPARVATDTVFLNNNLNVVKDSISKLKREEDLSYADSLESQLRNLQKAEVVKKPHSESNWLINFLSSKITMYLFWAIAACFVVFLLYNIFLAQGIFRKKYVRAKKSDVAIEKDEILTVADYDRLIAAATSNKDYRLAVRYLYLKSLQLLIAKGLVTPGADKTNYQYVQELYGKSYKNDFAALTLNYEYIWYGEFEIDETAFSRISNHFEKFQNQL